MSFPSVLMKRELGMPGAQLKIEEALDRKIANCLTKDHFHFETIELSPSFYHRIFRTKDLAAVISASSTDLEVQRLSLWSLITKSKIWELEASLKDIDSCSLSDSGLVLIKQTSERTIKVFYEGKLTRTLPSDWKSIHVMGTQILGSWAKLVESFGLYGPSPKFDYLFAEIEPDGVCFNHYSLDGARWEHVYACDENYWARLSGSIRADHSLLIEVVDRVCRVMKTFRLPSIQNEKFTSACIVKNWLIYGKNSYFYWDSCFDTDIREYIKPTIGIFDLVEGVVLDEFPTGSESGKIRKIVANNHFVAWAEIGYGRFEGCVKYLNLSNKAIKQCAKIDICLDGARPALNIVGSVLSVSQQRGCISNGWAHWQTKVIDLTSGEIKSQVRYKRFPSGTCSIENGTLLITDPKTMYIESFMSDGNSKKESDFRDPNP